MKWPEYLAEIKARLEDATAGPWEAIGETTFGSYSYVRQERSHLRITEPFKQRNHGNDSLFVSHSRTDIPRLVARCEELEEALIYYDEIDWPSLSRHHKQLRSIAREVLNKGIEE